MTCARTNGTDRIDGVGVNHGCFRGSLNVMPIGKNNTKVNALVQIIEE